MENNFSVVAETSLHTKQVKQFGIWIRGRDLKHVHVIPALED